MKFKAQIFSLLFIVMFAFTTLPASAKEKSINSIEINVVLNEDGSASITEIWDVSGISDGTEYYKELKNMNEMKVHSLTVSDESGQQYENIDNWNTKLSLAEKAGKSGILKTSKGYELCWGMGSYGDHTYTINYVIDGLVKDYGDYAGFYHQFLGELSSAPNSVFVKIRINNTNLDEKSAQIKGYGFPGQVEISSKDGVLIAFSTKNLGDSDYVNLLCRFDRDLFASAQTANKSFADLEKSADSANSNAPLFITLAILLGVFIIGIILTVYFYSRYKLINGNIVRLPSEKNIGINASIPFRGNISATCSALKMLRRQVPVNMVLNAYLISWQKSGIISIKKHEGKKSYRNKDGLVFNESKKPTSEIELSLYNILKEYTVNNILHIKTLEDNAFKLSSSLNAWEKQFNSDGENELIRLKVIEKDVKGTNRFTEIGFEQAVKLLGVKNYLKDMKEDINKKSDSDDIWSDYIILSTLFGMSEKVVKQMQVINPHYFNSINGGYGCDYLYLLYFINFSHSVSNSASSHSTSSAGGGGFSGGGGGGSR